MGCAFMKHFQVCPCVTGFLLTLGLALRLGAAQPIDGRSASRWEPQPGWTPGREAAVHGVRNADGWLEFSMAGSDQQMTWTLHPTPQELAGEPRYLLLTYEATGLSVDKGSYLLVVRDGSPAWRNFLNRGQLVADGWVHQLAVDVLSYAPPEPINRFALRIGPATAASGRLRATIEFVAELPTDAVLVRMPGVEPRTLRIEPEHVEWRPSPHFTPRPPESHEMALTERGVRFAMVGQQRSMRWSATAPDGLVLGELPFVAVRYRATGRFGPGGYAFYVGVTDAKGKRVSAYAAEPGNIDGDGAWHVFRKQLEQKGSATSMAVGIDSLSPSATLEVDYVEFSSVPVRMPVSDMITYEVRDGPWPSGNDGLETVALAVPDGGLDPFFAPRLGLGDWFTSEHITVAGIPFSVPAVPDGIVTTGTVDEGRVAMQLPEGTREVLFLMASSFPAGEAFGTNWRRPTPLRLLTEPERLTVELTYDDGTSDHLIPINVSRREHGVGHDIACYAVHAASGRSARVMILHDNMRNAAFGIVGVTANRGGLRVPAVALQSLAYPLPSPRSPAPAEFAYSVADGLTWDGVVSDTLGGRLALRASPVFVLEIGGRRIPSSAWDAELVDGSAEYTKIVATYAQGEHSLRAEFVSEMTSAETATLSLRVSNAGGGPVTGTLFFPTVSGVRLGTVADTWYFCARRGGVVNRVPCNWRDEIGELHPLQVDGFFSPELGGGLCFMPRDREEIFRWYQLRKDDDGCHYALEYLPQTVGPGEAWASAPLALAVVPGDWRNQFHEYLKWVRTWHKPSSQPKQWFREVFAFGPGSPTGTMHRPVEQRLDLVAKMQRLREAIGACDYMHLFGWAKTATYGHWGDYDHYDAVGGKSFFVNQVKRCQSAEIPVGLYLDGYLVSTKSVKPSEEQRERWAVRKADGEMLYHTNYDAHSMCPYVAEWRRYLTDVYVRVAREVQPDGMYIDEFGKCMTRRTCHSAEHGHPTPMGMAPGEGILLRQIREALPERIATYCEYVPSDVASQYADGAFGHVPLHGWRDGYDRVAPHYVNLQRFAFPEFKTFQLIYYVPQRNGNWFLLKYPFFNGDGYYLTRSCLESDEHAQAFLRRAFGLLHAHQDAFTSTDVEPLVRTQVPELFANRFRVPGKTVWTLFNANYRTVRGELLIVSHRDGAQYTDAWRERRLAARVEGGSAALDFELGPRAVGCVVQQLSGP